VSIIALLRRHASDGRARKLYLFYNGVWRCWRFIKKKKTTCIIVIVVFIIIIIIIILISASSFVHKTQPKACRLYFYSLGRQEYNYAYFSRF
jgi:hypothetical protein